MPRATLSFKLPEEAYEFKAAEQGGDARAVLWDLDQYLRTKIKYGGDYVTPEKREIYEELRGVLRTLLHDRDITLDD